VSDYQEEKLNDRYGDPSGERPAWPARQTPFEDAKAAALGVTYSDVKAEDMYDDDRQQIEDWNRRERAALGQITLGFASEDSHDQVLTDPETGEQTVEHVVKVSTRFPFERSPDGQNFVKREDA
jgi:hypothetical protein